MMRDSRKFSWVAAAIVAATLSQVGCATLAESQPTAKRSLADRMPWSKKDATPTPYPNPVKMAVTWTPDTLVQTGRTPTRGFGGRIYFYDDHAHAVPVEGTLVIHGFNETAVEEKDRMKRFEFTPDQFTKHFGQTDLGASYSIWVPWDAVGGTQERISLVASFKSTSETRAVQSVPAVVVLPGHSSEKAIAERQTPMSPQYERWRAAASATAAPTSGLTTTTIHRRRGPEAASPASEGLKHRPTMLAQEGGTPAVDLPMQQRSEPRTILPTSGWAPTQ